MSDKKYKKVQPHHLETIEEDDTYGGRELGEEGVKLFKELWKEYGEFLFFTDGSSYPDRGDTITVSYGKDKIKTGMFCGYGAFGGVPFLSIDNLMINMMDINTIKIIERRPKKITDQFKKISKLLKFDKKKDIEGDSYR